MNNSYNNQASNNKENIFSRIVKYFSRESIGIKIIFFVGIASILLGSWRLISGVKNAFVLSPISLKDKAALVEGLNRLKDTDGDGLSDYDELYTYGTSPYLVDSDSDGVSDYDEIVFGQGTENTSKEIVIGENTMDMNEALRASINTMTLDEFKKELLNSGYDKEIVDVITEENFEEIKIELNKSLSENNEVQSSNSTNTTNTVSTSTDTIDAMAALEYMTAPDIRQLLKDQGVTDEQLQEFSDEEIIALFKEALQE